jgi:hypothetical protein
MKETLLQRCQREAREHFTLNYLASFDSDNEGDMADLSSELIATVNTLIANTLKQAAEEIEKLKRTDDTQMSHDHTYDEALTDAQKLIRGELDI